MLKIAVQKHLYSLQHPNVPRPTPQLMRNIAQVMQLVRVGAKRALSLLHAFAVGQDWQGPSHVATATAPLQLVQRMSWNDSELLQLPHFTVREAKHATKGRKGASGIADYLKVPDEEKKVRTAHAAPACVYACVSVAAPHSVVSVERRACAT